MHTTQNRAVWVIPLAFLLLTACAVQTAQTAETSQPIVAAGTSSPTADTTAPARSLTFLTPSPYPTLETRLLITPDRDQLTRWQEYEQALAKKLLSTASSKGKVLCEWELLGRAEQEVYVWAHCKGTTPVGENKSGFPAADMPAVVRLDEHGNVLDVDIPGAGTHYAPSIRKMFPPDVQERIFEDLIDYHRLSEHLELRFEHPEQPPLIVISATQQL
jgi:hypothetical protein